MADALAPSRDAVLLEALADTGEALTRALVERDRDGIVAATAEADRLVDELRHVEVDADAPLDPTILALGARVATGARRNAILLERAWATDAALLRLLATAARPEPVAGPRYVPAADAEPAGWLDRSA